MCDLPVVSVLMPVYNEERDIAACLDSVLAGDYPHECLEILVIDGMSTDRSPEIIQDYAERHPVIRLLTNPKRIQAAGLNIGIREARGEIIVRMDAHTMYAPDYVSRCVELLGSSGAANVGGPQTAVGTDYVTNAIAAGMTTPFGVGDARYRYTKTLATVETVYLGAWRKSTLQAVGGFNEDWALNEDYELNIRLREAGGRILVWPAIKSWYWVRSSLGALGRQYFRYAIWRVKTLVEHPDSLIWRQLAPPALVVALLISLALLLAGQVLGLVLPAMYLAAGLVAAIGTASRKGWRYLPLLPIVFGTIHVSWGAGFLAGIFRWGWPRIRPWYLAKAFGHRVPRGHRDGLPAFSALSTVAADKTEQPESPPDLDT